MKRIILQKHNKGYWQVLAGEENMNFLIYVGSLANANRIRTAYLATGEYVDESPDEDVLDPWIYVPERIVSGEEKETMGVYFKDPIINRWVIESLASRGVVWDGKFFRWSS